MNDPWHRDTLAGLIAIVDATKLGGGTAYALVIVSSERLGGEVVGELRARLDPAEVLRVCTYIDPRNAILARLGEPLSEVFRTTIIQGLPAVLESEHGKGLLNWLNFRRESFTRPREAFVFVVTREAADLWMKEAPDLDRYTSHFDFQDWDDLVETAQRVAATTELAGEAGETRLRQAKERLQQAHHLGGDFVVGALLEVANLEMQAGQYVDAERLLAEAWSLARVGHPVVRGRAVLARASLLLHQGHPDAALQSLRSVDGAAIDDVAMAATLGDTYVELGKLEEASALIDRYPELARRRAEGYQAGNLFYAGELRRLVKHTMAVARQAAHEQSGLVLVRTMTWLARASLLAGRPRRAVELLDELRLAPGNQSALFHPFVSVRAEALWIVDGPTAVAPLLYEEEQRQRGWTAPVPAAELRHARGLAAANDGDARTHFEDAASRFRAMSWELYLAYVELWLARLDRFCGDLDRATSRISERLAVHASNGWRPIEARDRTELAMIALGRRDPKAAHDQALQALELIRSCGARLHQPAALLALAAAERALGNADAADVTDRRWRRLVRGIDAKGLEAALERDAAWAAAQTSG